MPGRATQTAIDLTGTGCDVDASARPSNYSDTFYSLGFHSLTFYPLSFYSPSFYSLTFSSGHTST